MRAPALVLLLAAAACGPDFPPRSAVFDTRVLAIEAEPLEVGPDESVTLHAYRVDPSCEPEPITFEEQWSFCPFSLGSSAGYACAVPECEDPDWLVQPAPTDACGRSNALTANPTELAARCLDLLVASGQLPADVPGQLPTSRFDVLFRYRVTGPSGPPREAVQRIPFYPPGVSLPAPRNDAPNILSVAIGGTTWAPPDGLPSDPAPPVLRHQDVLDVVVTVAGEQEYVEGGRTLTEQLVVSFYASAGRFDYDRANGPEARVKLEHEETGGATSANVWVVARDLRGGETVRGPYRVTIEP